jgi:uncharacterized membrane protein YccC
MSLRSLLAPHSSGLHYAVRIFLGTTALWFLLRETGDTHGIWAIISLIVVTEPQLKTALVNFRFRIYNTALGCAGGLLFLFTIGPRGWSMPLAATVTAFAATYLIRSQPTWRIAPITAVIVMTSGLMTHSRVSGMEAALQRTGEVLLGGAMALLITWLVSLFWMPPDAPPEHASTG